MKTSHELISEFLAGIVSKSDEDLLSLINQDFLYEHYFSGNSLVCTISTFNSQEGCACVSLFEGSHGANVLAILAVTGKEKSFNVVMNHLAQGDSTPRHKLRGSIYFLDHEREGFDGSISDAEALQEDPNSNWIFTPDIQAQNFYKLQKTDDTLQELVFDLKKCDFEWFRANSKVIGDEIWVVIPISLLIEPDKFEFPEDSTIDEFKYCSMSPKHVTARLRLEALEQM